MNDSIKKKIEQRAYEIYVKHGKAQGNAKSDWEKAEREILAELNAPKQGTIVKEATAPAPAPVIKSTPAPAPVIKSTPAPAPIKPVQQKQAAKKPPQKKK
jgi:hypothetical protein